MSQIEQGSGAAIFRCASGPDDAKYVGYQCAGGYYGSTDMPTALHPQTIMAVTFAAATLAVKCGYPFELRIAKPGFKNAKWVTTISRDDRCPNWFSGS